MSLSYEFNFRGGPKKYELHFIDSPYATRPKEGTPETVLAIRRQEAKEKAARDRLCPAKKQSRFSIWIDKRLRKFAKSKTGRFLFGWLDIPMHIMAIHTFPVFEILDNIIIFYKQKYKYKSFDYKVFKKNNMVPGWRLMKDSIYSVKTNIWTYHPRTASYYFSQHGTQAFFLSILFMFITSPFLVITGPYALLWWLFGPRKIAI